MSPPVLALLMAASRCQVTINPPTTFSAAIDEDDADLLPLLCLVELL